MSDHDQTDPRELMRQALDAASAIVGGLKPDMMSDPTPCTEFDVATLTNHLTGAITRAASIAHDVPVEGMLESSGEEPAQGWVAAFEAAREDVLEAWTDDALLGKMYTLPWATVPGAGIVTMYAMEAALHSWDLAVATDQEDLLDDAVSEALLPTARQFLPAEHRGGEIPFAPVVEIADDARAADRLAAFTGRGHPAWPSADVD
jgi:uncharacterized protein (TIGR03086 family)